MVFPEADCVKSLSFLCVERISGEKPYGFSPGESNPKYCQLSDFSSEVDELLSDC